MISVALAGGGERVVAWEIGVLAGLADTGLDLRGAARIVGTSAGALVAARLAAGEDPREAAEQIAAGDGPGEAAEQIAAGDGPGEVAEQIAAGPREVAERLAAHDRRRDATERLAAVARPSRGAEAFAALAAAWEAAGATVAERRRAFGRLAVEASPGGEERFVARQEELLAGVDWSPALRIVAVDADSGRRVVFDAGSSVPLARAVAASRAVPTLRPPVQIGGRRFIDGALGSATNADLLTGEAIVVAPFSSDDPLWAPPLRDELARLGNARVI
ncbi:MAG TPA: patatin-like phospholipase family protein, partial [Solirubrobacter sp.]|nr:patatin-like phospholipase family protein [Solirubrobacter sp.]